MTIKMTYPQQFLIPLKLVTTIPFSVRLVYIQILSLKLLPVIIEIKQTSIQNHLTLTLIKSSTRTFQT